MLFPKRFLQTRINGFVATALILFSAAPAWSQPIPGSMRVRWNTGAEDCASSPQEPLQVHAYEPRTFILRQNPCVDPEANFLYLLVGSNRALLIDTGAVAETERMPLSRTVLALLPLKDEERLPLLVVHTHGHLDHRAGDAQFAASPGVQVTSSDLADVRAFFRFDHWPEGVAHLDLGGRVVDVIPTPGHHPAHISFYDDRTAIFFSGDFLLPGRLLIEDEAAYRKSAARAIGFVAARPVAHILGGHIELDAEGRTFAAGSQYHPNERALELSRQDLLALEPTLERFNGFYAKHENFALSNPMHNLLALIVAALALLSLVVLGLRWFLRRRRGA